MGPNTPEDDNKQYENISDNEMSHEILRMVCVFFLFFLSLLCSIYLHYMSSFGYFYLICSGFRFCFFQIVKSVEKIGRRKSARKTKRKVCISCFFVNLCFISPFLAHLFPCDNLPYECHE